MGTLESCGCCLITPWESDLSLSGGKHGPHTEQWAAMHVYVCMGFPHTAPHTSPEEAGHNVSEC